MLETVSGSRLEPLARKAYGVVVPSQGNRYDRQTFRVMRRMLAPDSNCVDVGAYRGEILAAMLRFAPQGRHFAFEPIPENCEHLAGKYAAANVHVLNLALSDRKGEAVFHHVVGRAARSGLQAFEYPDKKQVVERLDVPIDTLDNVIPKKTAIDLIKIDVEGAELGVLLGAKTILQRDQPTVIFEHEYEKAKRFGTSPEQVHDLLVADCGLQLFLMSDFLAGKPSLSKAAFTELVGSGREFYFMATAGPEDRPGR